MRLKCELVGLWDCGLWKEFEKEVQEDQATGNFNSGRGLGVRQPFQSFGKQVP